VFKFFLLLEKEAKWGEFGLSDIYTRYAQKFILKERGSSLKRKLYNVYTITEYYHG
jgi:hypothetical protein